MNPYFQHLHRIEFVVTLACTGACRHCSEGGHTRWAESIDASAAVNAVRKICARFPIDALMTFGGEPLLCPDTVCAIHRAAAALGIAKRQVITNGFFSKNAQKIGQVVRQLADSGVNDVLLSVDAFHQETIPMEPVLTFADCAIKAGLPLRLNPAWLVSPEDGNPYNQWTRDILGRFTPLGVAVAKGNVVFPSGNALKYLREYFGENVTEYSPYEEDPQDIRTLSFSPNGGVLDGNIYQTDILEILRAYHP